MGRLHFSLVNYHVEGGEGGVQLMVDQVFHSGVSGFSTGHCLNRGYNVPTILSQETPTIHKRQGRNGTLKKQVPMQGTCLPIVSRNTHTHTVAQIHFCVFTRLEN